MDVTETNAESDESFEVIPFPETDDFNTEIFENPVIAVSINTESSIEQVEGGENHGEKNIDVKTKPLNISFVCLDHEPYPNSGSGSHTFTSETKYNVDTDYNSSDMKDENHKMAIDSHFSTDTTIHETNICNKNTDKNSQVTINDTLPTYMVDADTEEKNTRPNNKLIKQNEIILKQQKCRNVNLHDKENEPPTILPIDLSADNKRIPVESTRRFEESNNLVIHCGQEDKPTKQKQDQNRMNIFKEQDSYNDALKSSIRNGNTIEGFQRNSEAINNEPKFESLGEHDVHHDEVEQNKAIERYQEASKFVEGNKSQKDHSEVEHKYKDMSLRDIQDTAATNQNEEIPQHKENNESKIEDTQNQFAQTAQVDRHVFETSRNSDMDKSDQSQPDDYGISSDTTGTSNLSDSVEIFPIQTLGINQGKSKPDETNIIMMLESYTSLSEENKCIVLTKILQNASTLERAFISDKLKLESEEVVNNTTNYKPSNTYQVRDGEDHKDHVMDTDQKPNTDLNSFSEDNSQHESKSDVEDLLYDKTRPTITTESQLNENGHRFYISQNTSSVKSYTLQHELQEHPSEETNNLPIKAESQQDEDGNGMDIIENTQSPFVPDKLQYDSDEITSQTDQKPSHTFNTHNNGYCINEPGSKVEEKDKKDSFQQKIKDSEDDMLADVNNVDNLQQESEKAVESPSSNKTRPTIQAGAVDVFKHELQHDQQDENPQNTNIMQNEESSTETKLFVHEELQYDSDDMINSPTEQKPSQTFNTQNNECCTNVSGSGVMEKDVQDVFQQEIKDSEDDLFADVSNDTQQSKCDMKDPGSKIKEKDKKNVFQQEIKDSKDDLLADVSNVDNLQHESEKAVESPSSNKTRPTIQADAVDEFKHKLQEDQQDESGHSMNIISKNESSKKSIVPDELQYDSGKIINSTTEQKPSQNAQNNESDMNDSGSKVKDKDTKDAFQQEIKNLKEDSLPDISSAMNSSNVQKYRGKIIVHTDYRTSGMIDKTTVGTNDLLLAIAGFSTESKSLLDDLSQEQSMSVKTILSKTVEIDPYQFKYLCSLMNTTLLDAGSSHNFEIMKVDEGKQRGFVVSGNDSEIVSQISNEISENAKHIKRKMHLLRQRVAILTLQKNHGDFLSSMGTRYNCLVSVDTAKNAELPTLRVESDYVATRGKWFMENGCEICLTLKEPELCQVDVLVEQGEQEGIEDDAVRFSPDLGLLNQVIIKIALSWNGGRNGEKDKLHKLLENVFLSATSLTHRSLAFGVQNFCGWPYKTFCKCLIFSLKQVSSDAIDKVYFCCQDENVCQNIKGILRDAAIKEFHAPSEKIGISVIEGELAKQKVDVIVNTTGRQLDLSNGTVSKSISNCAGNGMQQEIKNKYPNGINYGDVAITRCHKLGCKTVLHCALYAWAVNGEEQKKCTQALQMCITKCLAEVDKQKHKTIAFPVLGAGNLSVPVKTAAGCMIDGIKAYGVSNPKTCITTVKIIVYKDKQILKTFNEMLEQHKGRKKSELKTTTNPDKCVVADLPAYKSPMTIEIIGPEDSIKNVVAEIEQFEKCPRQSLSQHWTAIKVEKTVPSATATGVPTTNPNSDNRSPVCRTKNDHGKQFIEKFQRLNLVRTEDVQCCLVAVKLPEGDDVKSIIEHELKSKQCQHYHVLYPYESFRQALITCRCREDAEYTITQSFDTFQVEELPAQILCNIEAEIRPDFLTLIPSKIEKSVLKKRLIEKSGVTISAVNERETWNLRGLQVQIETALDFLQEYLDSTKGQFQDLNSTVDFCTKATDMSSVKDTTATCTSAKDNQPIALHNYQASATSYADKKHSDVKEHAKATIAVREIESVSLEEYLAFQTFFPDISHLFAKENETMEYKAETRTISVVCERQNIDNVFEAVKQRVLTLKSYSKEIVPYQQSDDLKLTSVHGDICKTFPGPFCSISDENREICLIGQNPKEVRDAKCHFELLLGNAVDRPVVSNNACQTAIPTCGDLKNSNVFNTANGLYVHVYQANILNLPVQCIVNAANRKLEHGGGVADVISKASGGVIEKESKGFIGTYGELNVGTACYTRAGTLKYEYVIHTVGPRWSDYKTKQESERQRCASDLQRAIQSAITTADQLRMTSVGIPPVSAGTYGVPKDICAKSYASGVIEASKLMTLKSTLKEIHFIDKDLEMVQLITKVFRDLFAEHNPISNNDLSSLAEGGRKWSKPLNEAESSLSSQERRTHLFYPVYKEDKSTGVLIHEFQLSEKLKVCVYTKALETTTVQAMVCGQDVHFQNKGAVAEGIRKVAGNTYGRRVEEARKQKLQFNIGEVVCLPGGEWITYVLHAVTPKWKKKGNQKQSFSKGVSKCYANVLKEAAELRIHTIAVPLLGAGSEGCSSQMIARILLDEILLFAYEASPTCSISEIHIVNKRPDITKVVVTLFDEHVTSEWNRLDAEGRA